MAYAALILLGQILEQILDVYEYGGLLGEQKVKYILGNISFLQTFLEEYSQGGGEAVCGLESRIRDAAYRAADIIESCMSKQILGNPARRLGKDNQGLQMAIRDIDTTVEEVMMLMSSCRVNYRQPSSSSRRAPNSKVRMVGLDEDLMQIRAWLCGESSKLQTISIVGMGGIGKTTLAKNVYVDSFIEYYFDKRAWTTVSQNYHVRQILLGLLDSMKMLDESMLRESDEKLAEHLYKCLKGRRYLIVIDDIWDTKAWDYIRKYFPDDDNGSRVLLTTKLSDVAVYASSGSRIHQMHFLDLLQSCILLTEILFSRESCPFKLKEIIMKIARSCKGLPLAISLVAGLLTEHKDTLDHWKSVAENIGENLNTAATGDDEQLPNILALSYNHLPHHLKACFLYLGIFPEDYEIPVPKLIKLWVAEGFLRHMQHKKSEEIAEECVEDLAKRSLILVRKHKYDGRIKTFSIHDLLRDLCLRRAREDKFLLHITDRYDKPNCIKIQHRLSILADQVPDAPNSLARSLLYFCHYGSPLSSFHTNFSLLKVLDAERVYFDKLPVEIVELVHLSYIAFTHNSRGYHTFPSSIYNLFNLQTLIVNRGPMLRPFIDAFYLPIEIWEMPKLRHVSLFYTSFLSDPSGVKVDGKTPILENLQTLTNVTNFTFTKKAIRMMRRLKKLNIVYGAVTLANRSNYGLNNLGGLRQLEKLCFTYRRSVSCNVPTPLNFAFPRNLKKLTLGGFEFPWEHMSVIGSLPNLEVLKLLSRAFSGREWEPVEGQFSRLVYLSIYDNYLEIWSAESTHFPNLKRLRLAYCSKLEKIPSDIGEISTLELIELQGCGPSVVDSAKEIHEEQQNQGNDAFQIRLYS